MSITYKGNTVYHVIDKSGEEIGYWTKGGVKYHSFYQEGPSFSVSTSTGKTSGSIKCYTGKPSQASIASGYTTVNNWIGSGFIKVVNGNSNKIKLFANATASTNKGGMLVTNLNGNYIAHDLANQSNAYTDIEVTIPANTTYCLGLHPGKADSFSELTINYTTLNIKNVQLITYTQGTGVTNYISSIKFYNPNSVAVSVYVEESIGDLGFYDYFTISAYTTATWSNLLLTFSENTTFYFAAKYYENSTYNLLTDANSFVAEYINDSETTT